MLGGMAFNRRNSAVKIYVNGSTANDLYGLAKRVGQQVSRMSSASQRAQSSLARKVQPVAKREIRNVYGVKAGILNGRMRLETGTRGKGDFLSLWASTRKVSLLEFGGRWRGVKTPGATASILLGTSKTYDSAFIANVGWRGGSGQAVKADTVSRAIYVRKRGPDGKRFGRGPLKRLYGPSVFEMIGTSPKAHSADTVRAAIVPQLENFYVTELSRQIALELRRG
jgi:hypothetical protein